MHLNAFMYVMTRGLGMSKICFNFLHYSSYQLLKFCVVTAFVLQQD